MNNQTAQDILEILLNGADPLTGEVLPDDHLCLETEVREALFMALQALRKEAGDQGNPWVRKNGKLNAGRPWTKEELAVLEQLFTNDTPLEDICVILQRRKRGVNNQLLYLGLIEEPLEYTQPRKPKEKSKQRPAIKGLERMNQPWTLAEDERLERMHNQEYPVSEIASALHRTERAVLIRMENRGFFGDVSGSWADEDKAVLRQMFEEGKNVQELSLYFHRPEKAIRARLFMLGLIKEAPFSIRDPRRTP